MNDTLPDRFTLPLAPPASAPFVSLQIAPLPPAAPTPPVTSTVRNVSGLLSLGWFLPAAVQRSFEWDEQHASRLLNDIDKALSRLPEPDEPVAADAHAAPDEEDNADGADNVAEDEDAVISACNGPAPAGTADDAAPPTMPAEEEDAAGHYFIGNLILCPAGPRRYEVYDGLQRLTTLTILIAVLRDRIQDEAVRAELDALIADDERYRLRLYGRDLTLVKHVQKVGATQRKFDAKAYYEIGRRILAVKNDLNHRIAVWGEARCIRYARFLLSSVWLSVLEVRNVRLARQMFVSTNLYGKQLEPIDLLKGQIADMISEAGSPEAVERTNRDWETAKQTSGAAFAEMLKAIDAIERTRTQDDAWPTELAAHLATAYPGAGLERFVHGLIDYADDWRDVKRLLRHAGPTDLERNVWRLHVFWWPEWHGLALSWWRQVRLARIQLQEGGAAERKHAGQALQQLERRFDRLHRRCMAITLAGLDEADRQRTFARALAQDKAGRNVFRGALDIFASQRRRIDRTLRSQIHAKDIWAPLMQWLEIARWRDGLPELMLEVNTEHVRPRRPDLGKGPAADEAEYNEGCYSIGNLAVITAKENPGLNNRDFAGKLKVLRRQARLFDTMHSVVYDDAGVERTEWTDAEISTRAEKLRTQVWADMMLKPPPR